MTKKTIQPPATVLSSTSNYFLAMQEHSENFHSKSAQFNKIATKNSDVFLSSEDGVKIYIKAVNKVLDSLKKIETNVNNYELAKKNKSSFGDEEKKKNQLNIILECENIRPIIDEFKKGFSVIPNPEAKDLILLLYKRFHFISNSIDHLIVFPSKTHLNEVILMLNRVNKTFEKMLSYTKTIEDDESKASDSKEKIRIKI